MSAPGPKKESVVILVNPVAGNRPGGDEVGELVRGLKARDLCPVLCTDREELASVVASSADLRCVVAAGGDGTVAEVLRRVPGVPVAVLPLGNENLVARHFHIERSGWQLAETVATGRPRRLDLGRAGGRVFSLMAGAGFDAGVVHQVSLARRGQISKLSYLLPILEAARSYPFTPITAEIPDTGERLLGATAFVFNFPQYGLGLPIAPWARPDDGLLDLCVCERPGRLHLLRYLLSCVAGSQKDLGDFHRRRVCAVRFLTHQPVPLQTDGDPAGFLPADVTVEPGAFTLLLPDCR